MCDSSTYMIPLPGTKYNGTISILGHGKSGYYTISGLSSPGDELLLRSTNNGIMVMAAHTHEV